MDRKEVAEKLDRILRLDTRPVGVKLVKDQAELPRKPLNFKVNLCQLVAMARYQGKTTVGVPELMICAIGAACTGLIRTPDAFSSGHASVGPYVKDEAAGKAFMANTYKLGDRGKLYDGVLVSSLENIGVDPDVVVIYANPAQVMRLIHASTYDTGEKVAADTVAEAALCSSIGFAVAENKPMIGFPCAGDRIYGGTQNSELVFTAPYALVRDHIVDNLERTAEGKFSLYPIPPNMYWTPNMPPLYTIRPEDLEKK